MYILPGASLGQAPAPSPAPTLKTGACDKVEWAAMQVPFHIDFAAFLNLVCCAVGRWMPFRTDVPPGRQAWCFVKRHEAFLWEIHTEMFIKKIPCVEFQTRYCRSGKWDATIDVVITF